MHAPLRSPSRRAQAAGLAATGFLTFAFLSSTAPAQEPGRERDRQPTPAPESETLRPRGAPQAGDDVDLANRLTRLHQEFTDRFREAVRGAQDERFAGASGRDVIITMLADRVVAGFPVHGDASMRPGAAGGASGETPGSRGAGAQGDTGDDARGGAGRGDTGQADTRRQGGDADADSGALTRRQAPGQATWMGAGAGDDVLGIVIIGGASGAATARPVDAGAPVGREPEQRRLTPAAGATSIAPGVYEVRWMGGDLVALVDQDGTPVLGTTVKRRDSGLGLDRTPTEAGAGIGGRNDRGAAGERGNAGGQDERGAAGQGERGGADQGERGGLGGQGDRGAAGGQGADRGDMGDMGRAMGAKPAWPQVYLAIVSEIASTDVSGR